MMSRKTAAIVSKILAGLILISTLRVWRIALDPWYLISDPRWLGVVNVALNFPGFALCLVGSAAILLERRWGYYLIYASLPFAIIGSCIGFILFLPWISSNPYVRITVLVGENLLVTAVLAWTHVVTRRGGVGPSQATEEGGTPVAR